jgi:hypothetical protein
MFCKTQHNTEAEEQLLPAAPDLTQHCLLTSFDLSSTGNLRKRHAVVSTGISQKPKKKYVCAV